MTNQMASLHARRVLEHLHECYMSPRPDWNCLGPPLPLWFRRGLAKIDKLLVPQFIPAARTEGDRGCDPDKFPHGVWVICRRLRSSRLLHKTWVTALVDAVGLPKAPTQTLFKVIRLAYNDMRNRRGGRLADEFDRQVHALHDERCKAQRERKLAQIAETMRQRNMRSYMMPRIVVPATLE